MPFEGVWRSWWREIVGAAVVLLTRVAALPRTPWEADEVALIGALRGWMPVTPHPVYAVMGRVAYFFGGDAFVSLVWLNVLAAIAGFVVLSLAMREVLRDKNAGAAAALILYTSAGVLVHSIAAMPDALALLFVSVTLLAAAREQAVVLGVSASLAVGCMPELAPAVIATLVVALIVLRRWLAVPAFVVASLFWIVPWLESGGGFVAPRLAERSVVTAVTRFALHPWGSKLVTLPLIVCAMAGAIVLARRFERRLLPLMAFAAMQLLVTVATDNPDDGVRPAVPAMLLVAAIAASGLAITRARWLPLAGAFAFAALSFIYLLPLLRERATTASPIARAAAHANATFGKATVLFDADSSAAGRVMLRRFDSVPLEEGLRRFVDAPAIELFAIVAGRSDEPEAEVFSSADTDVHRKLLGSRPRSVTIDPVRVSERYVPLRNGYELERTAAGDEWRWLGPDAAIALPTRRPPNVTLTLRLSQDAPFATNEVTVGEATVAVTKQPVTITVPAVHVLTIRSARSFVPARVLGTTDRRELAVQLVDVE